MKLQEKQLWSTVGVEIKNTENAVNEAVGTAIKLGLDQPSFNKIELIQRVPDAVLSFLSQGIQDFCTNALAKQAAQESIKSIHIRQENRENFEFKIDGQTLNLMANFSDESVCGIHYPHQNDYVKFLTENL